MFAVAEARGTLDTLALDGSVAAESADSSITISLKQWPVEAAEFTDFLSSRTLPFTVLTFFLRLIVDAADAFNVDASTFLSYVPANVGSPALTTKVQRFLRSHGRSFFPVFERDGNVWCVLCFTRATASGGKALCEVHHWYKHKRVALEKLATHISAPRRT